MESSGTKTSQIGSMMDSKAILVLGTARSGTSMIAGLLHKLGVDLRHKVNPSYQNPMGAFETTDWNEMTGWLHMAWKNDVDPELIRSKLQDMVELYKTPLWGFKSALTHFHLEFILSEIENPHLVVTSRDPEQNAKSFIIHTKDVYGKDIAYEEALKEIELSNKILQESIYKVNVPIFRTSYSEVKNNPQIEFSSIANFIGVEVPETSFLDDFILQNYTTLREKRSDGSI